MKVATSILLKLKSHFAGWRSWELNPVVVKELRQAVRSWAVTGMLLLFLTVLFCTAVSILVSQSFEITANQRLGGQVFQVFTGILTGASLIFIPLYVGIRLAVERQDSNLDLLYITTLTPARIIRGKFFCGAYMTLLFFSACMPFMAFTNLLRGVDLPTVAFILLYLFLVVCVAIQAAIFIACLPISKLFKLLLGLGGVAVMIPTTAGLTFSFYTLMRSGVGSMMGGSSFWSGFATVAALVLAAVVLLHFLSIALISPVSANRALPIKIYLTSLWIVAAVGCAGWMWKVRDVRPAAAWCIGTLLVMAFSAIVAIGNSDQLSLRVRRAIPRSPVGRAVAFLFYNGAAGGLLWVAGITAITYVVTSLAIELLPAWNGMRGFSVGVLEEFRSMVGASILYVLAYVVTALFIQRTFFPRRPSKLASIIAVLLPALWALIPNVVLFFGNRLSFRSIEASQLGNLFNVYMVKDAHQRRAHLVCAGLWLLVALILNLRWFARRWREFRALEKWEPSPQEQRIPPRIPTASSLP